ncbi:T9SS type A sorting domain-containing protein [Rurimicrobium arvi]|uniref:Ig-like domain-containing protein n=1 Tax=Rurimicrobium arvi TaxID=2049916 RepID=A0ABP8MZQ8_9BACT
MRKLLLTGVLCAAGICGTHKVTAQTIYTIAGTGASGYSGDGGAATSAKLNSPYSITLDAAGNLYFTDNLENVVRKVDVSTRVISTVVGTGTAGSTGDGSAASAASLNGPAGIAFDGSGNMYVVETAGNRVRKINTSGVISTIAGDGTASSTGDGSAATSATLNGPTGIIVDASGNIYIAEGTGNRVRKINTSGTISTVIGDGTASSAGDSNLAVNAKIRRPAEMAFDASGNLYIAEQNGNRVRKIEMSSGNVYTYAGTGAAASDGDGGLATAAKIRQPTGLAFDASGNLYIVEAVGRFVRKVDASGYISTVAGTGTAGYSGDGGDPELATFRRPYDIAFMNGNLFLSDFNANVLRMICDPSAPLVRDTTYLCKAATASALTANGTNLKWYTDASGGTVLTAAPTPSTATAGFTTYYVSQTSFEPTCESPRAAMTINVIEPTIPAPVATTSLSYCKGATATALAATGSSLKWYTVATGGTASTTAPTPSTASAGTTSYFVAQTEDGPGFCEGPRTQIDVVINPLPTAPTVTSSIVYCVGATATTLSATGTSLQWYTAATGGTASTTAPTPSTSGSGTTTYYVSQTSDPSVGSCEGPRASIAVTVNSFPSAPTVPASSINLCVDGPSSVLTASGSNLKWYDDATAGTLLSAAPTPATAAVGTTTYYVSQSLAASAGGCESGRTAIAVTVNARPDKPVVTSPIDLCVGVPAPSLSATGTSLLWYSAATGGTGATISPSPATASTGTYYYYVSQTSSAATGSCEGSRASIQVNVQPSPVVSVASLATSGLIFCPGKTITFEATAPTAVSYQWQTEGTDVPGAISATYAVGTTGFTGVEVTDIYGCKNYAELYAQEDPSPRPVLTPSVISVCEGNTVLLNVSPRFAGYTFDWYKDGVPVFPSTPSDDSKGVTSSGTYGVVVTNTYGCIYNTGDAVVSFYAKPAKPTITNASPTLSVPSGYSYYQWFKDGSMIIGANSRTYVATGYGNFHVEVDNIYGCSELSDTVTIEKPSSVSNFSTDNQIRVYPNPTTGLVRVDAAASVSLRISDLTGKIIREVNANRCDITDLSDGIYFLSILDENKNIVQITRIAKSNQ